jgi:FAD:protein FMN transferase
MERHVFQAMGTEVEIILDAEPGPEAVLALAGAEMEFERLEQIFSRFRPDSELSQLNEEGGIEASDELLDVVAAALEARRRTGGRFDPTVHDALVAAGYDRSFELLDGTHAGLRPPIHAVGGAVDIRGNRIELAPDVRLDLGGIAKGYAADHVAAGCAPLGACLVNAGGDIATAGGESSHRWAVGVETHDGSLTLALGRGGLATSGSDRRRWETAEGEAHHLIDPATGRPADSDLLRVTVVAGSSVEAEVAAKALFLAGEAEAAQEADAASIPAVLVTLAGRTRLVGGLR